MPSVVGLLEQHELAARQRVDELREEADRVQAEPAAVEQEWQEWVIARRRVDTVLAPDDSDTAEAEATVDSQNADAPPEARDAAKPKTQVPVWGKGLAWSVLSVASSMTRWQYAPGRPHRPRSQPATGSSGRTTAHSASVMSEGYRRTRSG